MPTHRMHMTALEITHSKQPSEITSLVEAMRHAIPNIVNYTFSPSHRCRLVKPMISFDLAAIAMSFLPAVDEVLVSPPPIPDSNAQYDSLSHTGTIHGHQVAKNYSYLHLRRDLYQVSRDTGINVNSRYVVPSAHITLGRYLCQQDHATPQQRVTWINRINEINEWLCEAVWNVPDGDFVGEWCVGQEKGLDCRAGALWYGGGRTIAGGEGF